MEVQHTNCRSTIARIAFRRQCYATKASQSQQQAICLWLWPQRSSFLAKLAMATIRSQPLGWSGKSG
ncbi:MAG: hypothetical protein ACBR15_10260 [Microcoleus sp.]